MIHSQQSQSRDARAHHDDQLSRAFADIRSLAIARLEELVASSSPDVLAEPLSMARTFETLAQRARIDEVHELAQQIAILAFERYGQPLILAEDLEALAARQRRTP